ncbi:hypothetical protein [Glycomyces paridis]|uniref:DUF3558 domain-containing protein n=1 Tax=Glycomyces paridis TaxID=2126555 RepID=A0A4S8P398_9ACTN|nr:hypothetical protein [Glycomyces paridis]THV24510.1 hypothetical protein E9998_21080 [Glycomyces paridis]
MLGAVLVLVLATAAVVLTKVFQSDEDPPASLVTSEAEPSTEEEPTTPAEEPTTEAEPSGAAHALVEDVCEVIEPEVSTYITVDDEETEAGINEFFGGSECYMTAVLEAGEFSTASFYVTQKADQEDLEAAAGDYEFDLGLISASCTVTEDVEGPWEQAVYFFGSQEDGCAFLGYTHTLLVLDGNMFIQAEIVYGDEESDGAAELAVLTGLAEAITEASIP